MDERSLAVDVAYVGLGTPGDGVEATNYHQFPIINENSVAFNFNEANVKAFKAMGIPDPWAVLIKKGDPDSIEFAIPSPTAEEILACCGGSIDSDGKWQEPIRTPQIKKSLKIQTLPYQGKYTEYVIVNGLVTARLSQAPQTEDTDLLLVKVTKQAAFTSAGVQKTAFTRQVKDVEKTAVTAIAITGTAKVGSRLTATTSPADATGTYKWYRKTGEGAAVEILNEEQAYYVPTTEDVGSVITVAFTGTDYYSGSVESQATLAVTA